MRKATFEVPSELMAPFAHELASRNLNHTLIGSNKYNEIIIEVSYRKEETEIVDELEEILGNLDEYIKSGGDYNIDNND